MGTDDTLDLGALVSQRVAEKLNAEFVEKAVDARVDELVANAVRDALQSYSDTGKLVREAVSNALRVNNLDLPAYGGTVAQILKTQIEAKVAELVAGRLAADMDELLSLAPKEIKLSEIADAMREQHDGEAYGEVITVIVGDNRYGSTWVYLDDREVRSEREKHICPHQLLIGEDGVICAGRIGGSDVKAGNDIGRFYGLDQKLRAYVACGTKIILDEDDVVTSVGDN